MTDAQPITPHGGLTMITGAATARAATLRRLGKAADLLRHQPDLLRARLVTLRARPDRLEEIAARSYVHSNGFAKVRLFGDRGVSLRLHIWPAGPDRPGDVDPHGHRWEFASWVAIGAGMSETYFTEVRPGGRDAEQYAAYDYGRDATGTGYLKHRGEAWLRRGEPRIRRPGTVYRCPRHVLHTVAPVSDDLVVTVVLQGPVVEESAPVYRLPGQSGDTGERPIGVDELDALFGDVSAAIPARPARRRLFRRR